MEEPGSLSQGLAADARRFRWALCVCLQLVFLIPANSFAQTGLAVTVSVLPPVNVLTCSAIRLGRIEVRPSQTRIPALAFRIDNSFAITKSVTGVTVRDASLGIGTPAERRSNIDSVALYLDTDDDLLVTAADSLLGQVEFTTSSVSFAFGGIDVPADSGRTFIVTIRTALFPHDGDSLDLFLDKTTDVLIADSTAMVGPDSVNSYGYGIVDGMIAAQLAMAASGDDTIVSADTFYNVLTVDIPRNGYAADTLQILSVENLGTAPVSTVDSLVLFMDDGNDTWGGPAEEARLGTLNFTGGLWSISGLALPLPDPVTRLFLGVRLADFPTNGATLNFAIPNDGLLMQSGNDGPIDAAAVAPDTFVIRSLEALNINATALASQTLIPGRATAPLLGLELSNSRATAVTVDSLHFALVASDPSGASQAELESQIDSVLLYLDSDGDPAVLSVSDTVIGSAYISNGIARLTNLSLDIPAGGSVISLSLVAAVSTFAKNGNLVNFALQDSADIFTSVPVAIEAGFPVSNALDHPVDLFPPELVSLTPVPGATLFGGQVDQEVMRFVLPPNGYATDSVESILMAGNGSLSDPGSHITMRLWHDLTQNGLSVDDILLGPFTYSQSGWSLSNLSLLIAPAGVPLVVSLDVTSTQFSGGTLQLLLPPGSVQYTSGAIGPDNGSVANPDAHLILPANHVTVVNISQPTTNVDPASQNNLLLAFALYNGYVGQTKTLTGLHLNNTSISQSLAGYSDVELGQVSLYFDSDGNGLLDADSLVATGNFASGELQLSGLNTEILPESLAFFFVTADIARDVIDADSLDVTVLSPADFQFTDAVIMNGDIPLNSGGYLIIDGSVNAQFESIALTPRSLRPGDTAVTLFAFRPPINGDQTDTLNSLTITNLLDADATDLTGLNLWLDTNGDQIRQDTDSLLASFTGIGLSWTASAIDLEIGATPPTLFVEGDVAFSAIPGRSFQAAIPLLGCLFTSGNDGPGDVLVSGRETFAISTSGLSIAPIPLAQAYTVGQAIVVQAAVGNVLASTMDSVFGTLVYLDDASIVTLDSSFSGPASIGAGGSVNFTWYYTASQPGTTFWRLRADAPGVPDTSAVVQTTQITIQAQPAMVAVGLINSIPAAVTRGQSNVFPLSIVYAHPDTGSSTAAVRLDSLRLRVEDGAGTPIPANSVLRRMVLSAGSMPVTILNVIPAQADVWLKFATPVVVAPGESQSYSLLVDIDSAASAGNFALSLDGAAAIPLTDANTGQPVIIDPVVAFPLKTASCRIDNPAQALAVSYQPLLAPEVNYGQQNVPAFRLYLRHPGPVGSSQIQLSSLQLEFQDGASGGLFASDLFSAVLLSRQQTIIGQLSPTQFDTTTVEIVLNLPITLSPNQIDSIDVVVHVSPASAEPGFQIAISDSTRFSIRDLTSGSALVAASDTLLTTGLVFPMNSGWTTMQQPAADPQICITSALVAAVVTGVDSLPLLDLTLIQPAGAGYSGTRVRQLALSVKDSLGNTLDPNNLFDRIGVSLSPGIVWYQPFVQVIGGRAVFTLTDSSLLLQPGDSLAVRLIADIEADVPYDHFGLSLTASTNIDLFDAVDSTHLPNLSTTFGCSTGFPFQTAFTQILLPAGRPTWTPQAASTQAIFPLQTSVNIFSANLDYINSSAKAELGIRALRAGFWRRTGAGLTAAATASVFDVVHLFLSGVNVASDSILAADSLVFVLPTEFDVSTGSQHTFELRGDIRAGAALGNYLLQFGDSSFLEVVDKGRSVQVFPLLSAGNYPVWSAELSLIAADLKSSFSNYPNPFIPSRAEITRFAYVLAEDATLDIKIYTTTGSAVRDLARDLFRASGSYTDLTWDGLNERGLPVAPGVYLCKVTARYSSGQTDRFIRRIAVLR